MPADLQPIIMHRKDVATELFHISEGTYRKREQAPETAELAAFRVPGESKPLVLRLRVKEYLAGPEALCQRGGFPLPGRAGRQRKNPRMGR